MADIHQSKADKKAKTLARLIIFVALLGFGATATVVYWDQITLYRDVLAIKWASTDVKQGEAAERLFMRGEDGIGALQDLAHSDKDDVKLVARQVLFNHDIDIVKAPPPPPIEEKPAPVEEKPAPVEEKPAPVEEKPAPVEEKPAEGGSENPASDSPPAVESGGQDKPEGGAAEPAPVEEKPAPEKPEKERAWF